MTKAARFLLILLAFALVVVLPATGAGVELSF
jgi:hypothetical protein